MLISYVLINNRLFSCWPYLSIRQTTTSSQTASHEQSIERELRVLGNWFWRLLSSSQYNISVSRSGVAWHNGSYSSRLLFFLLPDDTAPIKILYPSLVNNPHLFCTAQIYFKGSILLITQRESLQPMCMISFTKSLLYCTTLITGSSYLRIIFQNSIMVCLRVS